MESKGGFMSRKDAAAYLGVNVRTLDRMIADRTLTAYRLGEKLIRIKVADLDALLRPIGEEE